MEEWKVIGVDNFDRDSVSDELVEEHLSEADAKATAKRVNAGHGDMWPWFYKAVPQDHKLFTWEP